MINKMDASGAPDQILKQMVAADPRVVEVMMAARGIDLNEMVSRMKGAGKGGCTGMKDE